MPVDKRKETLRSMLAGKTMEELEELLALDFTEQDDAEPDVEYITTILEVIAEREGNKENVQAETEAAWKDFQEYCTLRKQEEALEAGKTEELSHDHHCKTEYGQRPQKYARVARLGLIAAAVVVLLCGTAFGWNIFQAIADWTEETFYFLTGQENVEKPESDVFEYVRVAVNKKTDLPSVPHWAPQNTLALGTIKTNERKDRCTVGMGFITGEREFSIRIIIHESVPEDYFHTYQKDAEISMEYPASGITHYIVGNNDTLSAMWTNGCVEGYIQGSLTLEEMQRMIDSIYEE